MKQVLFKHYWTCFLNARRVQRVMLFNIIELIKLYQHLTTIDIDEKRIEKNQKIKKPPA